MSKKFASQSQTQLSE